MGQVSPPSRIRAYMNEDIFLLCVYMRASSSTREDINDGLNCYDILMDQVARVSGRGSVLIAGDMNTCCGVIDDWVMEESSENTLNEITNNV